jgi:flavorubredoxin
MLGFHRRYMASNSAIRAWLARVRQLDVRMIVPQHGNYFDGPMVQRFYEWIAGLRCGVDLIDAVEVTA